MHGTIRIAHTKPHSLCGTCREKKIIDSCFFLCCLFFVLFCLYDIVCECVYFFFFSFLCASFCCLHIGFVSFRLLSSSSHILLFKCVLIEKRNKKKRKKIYTHTIRCVQTRKVEADCSIRSWVRLSNQQKKNWLNIVRLTESYRFNCSASDIYIYLISCEPNAKTSLCFGFGVNDIATTSNDTNSWPVYMFVRIKEIERARARSRSNERSDVILP